MSTNTLTGFKDIYIDSLLVLNSNFLPVNNIKILQLEKTDGEIEGIWYNAVGELQLQRCADVPVRNSSKNSANNIIMAIPDEDATNTFVLKNGDTMKGPLKIERHQPAEKLVMSPYAGSTNIVADLRLESSDGINWGFHIMFRPMPDENIKQVIGTHFWVDNIRTWSIYKDRLSAHYKPIKEVWPVVDNYDAANKLYVDQQVATRIDYVTAGSGLSGGGTSGSISLDVNTGNGIEISGDVIVADGTLLRTNTAAAIYLTKSAATVTYLAVTNAATKYLTINTASNTYFLKENLPIISGVYHFAGPVNLNSNSIKNISWPSNEFDAVHKAYVLSVLTNGETVVYISTNELTIISNNFYFSGDLILKDGQIWGLSEPMSNDNAATKLYVDTATNFLETSINSNISSNFLKLSGGKLSGQLSAPQINLYGSNIIKGYIVSGNSHPEASGLYTKTRTLNNGKPVYRNEENIFIFNSGQELWVIANSTNSFFRVDYDQILSSSTTVPLGTWDSGSVVSEQLQFIPPTIDFANGKAINLQDGTNLQDAATISQLNNQISATKKYVDDSTHSIWNDNPNQYWININSPDGGDGSFKNPYNNLSNALISCRSGVYILGPGNYGTAVVPANARVTIVGHAGPNNPNWWQWAKDNCASVIEKLVISGEAYQHTGCSLVNLQVRELSVEPNGREVNVRPHLYNCVVFSILGNEKFYYGHFYLGNKMFINPYNSGSLIVNGELSAGNIKIADEDVATVNYVDNLILDYAIPPDSIETKMLKNKVVTGAKIADDTITFDNLNTALIDPHYVSKDITTDQKILGPLTVIKLNSSAAWNIGNQPITIPAGNDCAGLINASWSDKITVTHSFDSSGYIVIITPTSEPPAKYWISSKVGGSFELSVPAGDNSFSFNYLIISAPGR